MIALPLPSLSATEAPLPAARVHERARPPIPPAPAELAGLIHDQVLQSLGVALLQAELCRRIWDDGEPAQAISELDGIVAGIERAVDALRGIMTVLVRASRG